MNHGTDLTIPKSRRAQPDRSAAARPAVGAAETPRENAHAPRRQPRTPPAEAYRDIYERYVDEASFLWHLRRVAVGQPHYLPQDIGELERRIDAHLDGLMTSFELGWRACEAALSLQGSGEAFTAAIVAFRSRDTAKIQAVIEAGLGEGGMFKGLVSALGWLPGQIALPWIEKFLGSKDLNHKYLAIAACSVRRENPADYLTKILQRDDCRAHAKLHARALRLAGELKRADLRDIVAVARASDEEEVKFAAHWASVLLGDHAAAEGLHPFAASEGPWRMPALEVAMRALPVERARAWLSALAGDPKNQRTIVKATGMLGDPQAVGWLASKMHDAALARVAGESFTLITGINLERHELAVAVPQNITAGPNDDPVDAEVALDEDEYLPWPDAEKVAYLWQTHGRRYSVGMRHFLGQPVAADRLVETVKSGYQRWRRAAALELALLEPSCTLVNIRGRAGGQS
jgi:uncharacterized protein (TIGR02270 family)